MERRGVVCVMAGLVSAVIWWIVADALLGTSTRDVQRFMIAVISRTFFGFLSGALLAVLVLSLIDRRDPR